jgi:uncharacterized membrane protein YgcG
MAVTTVAESPGRSARWNTALVLVPTAAALFGGAVAWAADTAPATSSTPNTPPTTTAPLAVDNAAGKAAAEQQTAYRRRLEAQIAGYRNQSTHLRQRLKAIQALTAELKRVPARGSAGGYPSGGDTSGGNSTGGYSNGAGSSGGGAAGGSTRVVVVAPPPVAAQPPAPAPAPPPVHATTGPSGHP